jgi:hypothetical protein
MNNFKMLSRVARGVCGQSVPCDKFINRPVVNKVKIMSAEEIKTAAIIKKYAGQYLIDYAKSNNTTLDVSNFEDQSMRFTHFIELLYPIIDEKDRDDTNYYVYNSALKENKMNTTIANQLILDEGIIINDRNFLLFDIDIMCLWTSDRTVHPLTKEYKFKSDEKVTVKYDLIAEVKSGDVFQESFVYRNNTYVFLPATILYLLFYRNPETGEFKIYVMQVFTNKVNKEITVDKLSFMSDYVAFPQGYTFGYYILDKSEHLTMQSRGKATVLSDSNRNAYMLLDREDGQFIYDRYE